MKLGMLTVVYMTIFGASICIFTEGESLVIFIDDSTVWQYKWNSR